MTLKIVKIILSKKRYGLLLLKTGLKKYLHGSAFVFVFAFVWGGCGVCVYVEEVVPPSYVFNISYVATAVSLCSTRKVSLNETDLTLRDHIA